MRFECHAADLMAFKRLIHTVEQMQSHLRKTPFFITWQPRLIFTFIIFTPTILSDTVAAAELRFRIRWHHTLQRTTLILLTWDMHWSKDIQIFKKTFQFNLVPACTLKCVLHIWRENYSKACGFSRVILELLVPPVLLGKMDPRA